MNIIELARQAHRKLVTEVYVGHMGQLDPWTIELLKIFADLVAAHEREECAKKCEAARETIWEYHEEHLKAAACNVCTNLAQAIRARGTT